ncbi:hypothetical protein [Marimonas arenosa]|uniref:DUF4153 domain-containing protein n=1 Tax=Marimonas arenosa TaxID=1795305 RepID=A0AAE3WFU7_9RHOB|nr:hypothetical protein [Marimonas arenosa]MDQ2092261.1 DUF4153 domain-containing protein [Marimonas arenosa]
MTGDEERRVALDRAAMALLGGAAGLALYVFVDVLPDRLDDLRWLLFGAALVMGAFIVVLALTGPVRLIRAISGALAVAAPAAVLLLWASFRYPRMEGFLDAGHGVLAWGAILFLGTPFVAAALQSPGGWRDYERLFDNAWTIVVRYAAAWLFVALFWAVVMLSDQLLQLVGLDVIEQLLRVDPVPYALSGLVLGLALAVIYELRDYVSPFLIHRLLRLLLPMFLPVVAVFILALPVRGLGGLFGSFSAAATLMGVAIAGITLISTALDRSDADAAQAPVMVWAARIFSLALPILSGLAIYAVWLRVAQYGWTPPRLMAALSGAFLMVYGLLYAALVLRGGEFWMARIREANRLMAMALVAVSMLWLTPVLNAEKVAARSQFERALTIMDSPQTMALWELAQGWGHAGTDALVSLEAEAKAVGADTVLAAIGRARTAGSRYAYDRQIDAGDLAPHIAELARLMPLRPEGATLPENAFSGLPAPIIDLWLKSCRTRLRDGRAGCVLVLGDFRPGLGVPNGYVLLNRGGRFVDIAGVALRDGRLESFGAARAVASLASAQRVSPGLTEENLAAVLDGAYEIVPTGLKALKIGDRVIIPDN